MTRFLSPFLILIALAQVSSAQIKIGVVDMVRAFNEFYKTKDASVAFQQSTQKVKEEVVERTNSYKALTEEAKTLYKESHDPVLSADAREKKSAELQNKAQELKAAEREIQEFQERRKGQLEQESLAKRRGLYAEISKAVQIKAKAANLDLILDKSSVSAGGMPVFLFLKDGALQDLTSQVIAELNKDAPIPAAAAPSLSPAGRPSN